MSIAFDTIIPVTKHTATFMAFKKSQKSRCRVDEFALAGMKHT